MLMDEIHPYRITIVLKTFDMSKLLIDGREV